MRFKYQVITTQMFNYNGRLYKTTQFGYNIMIQSHYTMFSKKNPDRLINNTRSITQHLADSEGDNRLTTKLLCRLGETDRHQLKGTRCSTKEIGCTTTRWQGQTPSAIRRATPSDRCKNHRMRSD